MKTRLIFSLLLLAFTLSVGAQATRTKDINESWDGIKRVNISHRHGTLEVVPGTGTTVKLEAQIMARAKDPEDAQVMIDHISISSNTFSDELQITTEMSSKNWTTIRNNTKVKFDDGSKANGILDYGVKIKLYIPDLDKLELTNRYHDIDITGDLSTELAIKQHDAGVWMRNNDGPLDLYIKYGDARIGAVGDAEIDLYDSDIEVESAREVEVKAKYSEILLGSCANIEMTYYDGTADIGTVDGDIRIEDKYSEFEVEKVENARVTIYDGKLELGEAKSFSGRSKYSDFKFGILEDIDLTTSYDDNFTIRQVGSFSCGQSKYSEFDIETLERSAKLTSHDDKFFVTRVSDAFESFEIDCKYTDVRLPLEEIPGYSLDAKTKFGDLKYPESAENTFYHKDNDVLELRADVGGAAEATTVLIRAYDSDIFLQ